VTTNKVSHLILDGFVFSGGVCLNVFVELVKVTYFWIAVIAIMLE